MALALQIQDLSKGFVDTLFSHVHLHAHEGMKIGLIGDNGSGKSSLLRILAGLDSEFSGAVHWSGDFRIGYLEQEIVSETFDVSGGEKKILRLTELFYGNYNVLLLDEPDNHLDLDHKMWFLQLVQDFSGIVIVISHDRAFLEHGVDTIWNLEEKAITSYPFGYSRFKTVYEEHMESRQHLWETQEKERLRLDDLVRRLRVQAAANDKFVGRYHSAEKRYERWVRDMVTKPPDDKKLMVHIENQDVHKRKTAIYLEHISKKYNDLNVLNDIQLHVFCGEKISISAPNGSGKTTLLNIIVGKLQQSSGIMRIGSGLRLGYYAQQYLDVLDEQSTPIDQLQTFVPIFHFDGVAYLKKFLFFPHQITQPIRLLSGGQKSRLQLAIFLARNPDILVLDEPTNHLDLKTVLALETFLTSYTGTLILVSHDVELVKNCVETVYHLDRGILTIHAQ